MNREKLIRAHFDAYSDFIWAKDLEPKFRQYVLTLAEMKEYREAWNRHTEARDWDWWREHTKNMPDAELRQDIAECHNQISALRKGLETNSEQKAMQGGTEFDRMIARATSERPKEPAREKEQDRDRER